MKKKPARMGRPPLPAGEKVVSIKVFAPPALARALERKRAQMVLAGDLDERAVLAWVARAVLVDWLAEGGR